MFSLGPVAARLRIAPSALEIINRQVRYQLLLLAIAAAVLLVLYIWVPASLAQYATVGTLAAPAAAVPWMGIAPGDDWINVGASLSCVATAATALFVIGAVRRTGGWRRDVWRYLPWVLAFAVTNALSEEIVFRLAVIAPLAGQVDTATILLLSAIAFGLPHVRGMPNGAIGVAMAGVLGWVLAKSVMETHGLFWAVWIHFLQDVVIFTGLVHAALPFEARPTRTGDARATRTDSAVPASPDGCVA
jgi:hypothetical protein